MEQSALLVQDDDVLGKEIDELPQLLLVLTELVLGLAAILYVRPRRVPTGDSPAFIEGRVVPDQEPAVFAVLAEDPLLVLERNGPGEASLPLLDRKSVV